MFRQVNLSMVRMVAAYERTCARVVAPASLPESDTSSARRPSRLSLGYEPRDVRLCRLGESPVTASTSVHWRRGVASGLPRLLCPDLSRRVSCTNPCTSLIADLGVFDCLIGRAVSAGAGFVYGAILRVNFPHHKEASHHD